MNNTLVIPAGGEKYTFSPPYKEENTNINNPQNSPIDIQNLSQINFSMAPCGDNTSSNESGHGICCFDEKPLGTGTCAGIG